MVKSVWTGEWVQETTCPHKHVTILEYIYRPQTKFTKVMFLDVSIILSTGGGVCPIACWDTHPPDQRQAPPPRPEAGMPPGADTPRTRGRYPPGPEAGTSPPCSTCWEIGQQVDGTHPTGMQSCFDCIYYLKKEFLFVNF